MVSSVAAYGLRRTPLLRIVNGDDSAIFRFFLSLVTVTFELDIRTLARFLYTGIVHLTAKFHHPTFNRSEVYRADKQTDRQRDAAENVHLASLRYARG